MSAFAYNSAWANLRLLAACQNLSRAEFEAERTGFFPSLSFDVRDAKGRTELSMAPEFHPERSHRLKIVSKEENDLREPREPARQKTGERTQCTEPKSYCAPQ
jgi:hypothetical protein